MKLSLKITLIILVIGLTSMKSDKPSYQYFDLKNNKAKYKDIIKNAINADVVLFGELHNNPISHWMELEITKDLFAEKAGKIILGAEMFESDNQLMIDEYFSDKISKKSFESEARLWNNYKTDYKPLFEFAHENGLKFIATNIPRRYASLVHKKGFEGLLELSDEARSYVAPLPIAYDPQLKGYKAMLEMMAGMGSDHTNDNLPKAQAVKDATMAHFILENLTEGSTFIHYNGTYHSNDFEGISWYLKKANPNLNILTIASVEQDTISTLSEENRGLADYTLCVPSDMTKTY